MSLEIKDGFKFLVGALLAAALMAWVFRESDLHQVADSLQRAWWPGILLCAAMQFSHNILRVWRWGILLKPVRSAIPFGSMFVAVVIGYMVTWVLPGRLGELVRPALLSGREHLPLAPTIGSVFTDRLLDAVAILCLFAGGLFWTPLSGGAAAHAETIRAGAFLMLPLALGGLLGLFLLARFRSRLNRALAGREGWIHRLGRTILDLSRGSESLRSPRGLFSVLALSLAAWLLIASGLWVGIRASGADIPFAGTLLLLPAIALGVALPTPGGVGGFHAAVTFGLTKIFGISQAIAIGTGILVHLASIVPALVLGAALIALGAVPLRNLRQTVDQMKRLGRAEGVPS